MELISLRYLHAFLAVASAGGVRRSAETLLRASSAVTRSVSALEECLDCLLFERRAGGMLLTPEGQAVRRRAERIEQELREVREDALRMRERGANMGGGIEGLLNERRLQTAILLAELHHMPSVAHAMGTSQPAVSQAIAKLDDTLGQPLFLRAAIGMVPTDASRRWIERFGRVLQELRSIPADLAALSGVVTGTITIGALPLARSHLLPSAIARTLAQHPSLLIRSYESPYEELTANLGSGKIDFILGALRPVGDNVAMDLLFKDRASLIVRRGHPLTKQARITLDDLAGYAWVLSRANSPLRMAIEACFARSGAPPLVPAVETGDTALLRGLLVASDMVTVVSTSQLSHELELGEVVAIPFKMFDAERDIGITTRKGALLSPGARALIDNLSQLSKHLP